MLKELNGKQMRVLIGCFLCMFLVQGCLQTFAIYMPQVALETGWKVSQVAIVSSTASLMAFFFNLLLAKALRRLSPKAILLIGCAFNTIHLVGYSLCSNVYMLWFCGALGGIAVGWGTTAPCTIIITNWFEKNRSQFVAAVVAGSMFGSVLLNPFAAKLIDCFGWRKAYVIQGLAMGGLAIAAVLLLVRSAPEGQKSTADAVTASERVKVKTDAKYILLALGIFLIGLSTNTENYLPAFWQSRGLSNSVSSYIMSFYALSAAVGSILMSKVNDRLGGRKYVMLTSIFFIVPLLLMAYTGAGSILILLIVMCIPISLGCKKAATLTPPLIVNEAYGRKQYSSVIGTFAAMLQLGIAASNFIIGPVLELGYPAAFTLMAALNLAGRFCILFLPIGKTQKV